MELLDYYLPVFKQLLQITAAPEQCVDYEDTRQNCIGLLELAIHEAEQLDLREEEKEAAQLAVIAWLDETVLRSTLPWCQIWQRELLQRKYLNMNVAGEHFFTLLSQLELTDYQARKVFLFCLQNGFQGKYGTEDQAALQEVIAEQRKLCLPEAWQRWPNDAAIVPIPDKQARTTPQRLYLRFIMAGCIVLFYFAIFLVLHHYTS